MALRFRKSIKLAPGIRMNLTGGGLSWTLGPRGASVGIGGRGTYFNAGIPGSGLSSRTRLNSGAGDIGAAVTRWAMAEDEQPPPTDTKIDVKISVEDDGRLRFMNSAGNELAERFVNQAKRQHGAAIQGLIQSACDKVNKQIESLGEIHSFTPRPDERVAYVPCPFNEPHPVAPRPKQPGFWDRIFRSRRTAIEMSNRLAAEAHEQAKQKWLAAREEHGVAE